MILPEKHLSIYESFIGFGGYFLKIFDKPLTVDTLWKNYIKEYEKKLYPVKFSFDRFLIALDFLYMIGAINSNEGVLYRETDKSNIE